MSAGQSIDHKIQIDAEIYFVYLLQSISEKEGLAAANSAAKMLNELESKLKSHNLTEKQFYGSTYAKNAEIATKSFFVALVKAFPAAKTFDFRLVVTEYRNKSMKGDIVINIGTKQEISVSLKNYKNSLGDIQTCSGTWYSFLINFVLESVGPGKYIDPFTGEVFMSKETEKLYEILNKLSHCGIVKSLVAIKTINDKMRKKYIDGDKFRNWSDTKDSWKDDCRDLSHTAIDLAYNALQSLPQDFLKKRVLKASGLDGEEELLMVGKGGVWKSSITHKSYKVLLEKLRESELVVEKVKKTIRFIFQTKDKESILSIDCPFTLQKNGAWHCPKEKYEGKQFHQKEGIELYWGDIRPKKSRQLNTSVNMWVKLKNAV